MPGEWTLLGVLAALYLHECAVWQRHGQYAFYGRPGTCRAQLGPVFTWGPSGGYRVAGPFPPLTSGFLAEGSSFDYEGARSRCEEWRAATRPLRLICNALFIVLFGGVFTLTWTRAWSAWGVLAIAGIPLWVAATIACARAVSRLNRMPFRQAMMQCGTLALSPLTAIRALDRVSVPFLSEYHPVLVASLLSEADEFHRVARRFLLTPSNQPSPDAAKVDAFVTAMGARRSVFERPQPEPWAESYCPRCQTQYGSSAVTCSDCEGLDVVRFSSIR